MFKWPGIASAMLLLTWPNLSQAANVRLEALPQVCIGETAGQACQLRTVVSWQADQNISACLQLADKDIHCWNDGTEGSWQLSLELHGPQQLLLVDALNRQPYAQLQLQINLTTPQKTRRRLRAPWGIF